MGIYLNFKTKYEITTMFDGQRKSKEDKKCKHPVVLWQLKKEREGERLKENASIHNSNPKKSMPECTFPFSKKIKENN